MTHTYVLGLGSNINPHSNIEKTKKLLGEKYKIVKESKFVVTPPIGVSDQPDFVNGTILIETDEDREALRQQLKDIEISLGRKKEPEDSKSAPRTIDIDILAVDGVVVHRDFHKRDFVKSAVLEILPTIKF